MPLGKIKGATNYHAQLRLQDKGCAIKELVVCLMLQNIVFGMKESKIQISTHLVLNTFNLLLDKTRK